MPDEEAIRAYQREQYDSGELRASVRDLAASLGRPQLTGAEKYVKGLAESVLKQCEKIERLEQERDRLRAELVALRRNDTRFRNIIAAHVEQEKIAAAAEMQARADIAELRQRGEALAAAAEKIAAAEDRGEELPDMSLRDVSAWTQGYDEALTQLRAALRAWRGENHE
jgi:ribosomal protein L16 Arg81 hydroxylase